MEATEYTCKHTLQIEDRLIMIGQTIFVEDNHGKGGQFWFGIFNKSGIKIGRVHVDKYWDFIDRLEKSQHEPVNNSTLIAEHKMMEKAKQAVKETLDWEREVNPETEGENLKVAINNILHMYLLDDITVKEMDALSCVIFHMVKSPREFIND